GPGLAVLPRGRTQVAQRDLALPVVELRDLAEFELVAFADAAGEVVENAAARRNCTALPARLRERELVDRAVGGKLAFRRQRRRRPGPAEQDRRRAHPAPHPS